MSEVIRSLLKLGLRPVCIHTHKNLGIYDIQYLTATKTKSTADQTKRCCKEYTSRNQTK
jgi:hypothetical protein